MSRHVGFGAALPIRAPPAGGLWQFAHERGHLGALRQRDVCAFLSVVMTSCVFAGQTGVSLDLGEGIRCDSCFLDSVYQRPSSSARPSHTRDGKGLEGPVVAAQILAPLDRVLLLLEPPPPRGWKPRVWRKSGGGLSRLGAHLSGMGQQVMHVMESARSMWQAQLTVSAEIRGLRHRRSSAPVRVPFRRVPPHGAPRGLRALALRSVAALQRCAPKRAESEHRRERKDVKHMHFAHRSECLREGLA